MYIDSIKYRDGKISEPLRMLYSWLLNGTGYIEGFRIEFLEDGANQLSYYLKGPYGTTLNIVFYPSYGYFVADINYKCKYDPIYTIGSYLPVGF